MYDVMAFKGYKPQMTEIMEFIGNVISLSFQYDTKPKINGVDLRKHIATVRLDSIHDVQIGDLIYFVHKDMNHQKYKNGLIIGSGHIQSIFDTAFQGHLIRVVGYFKDIRPGCIAVRIKNTEAKHDAFMLLRKGDTAKSKGDSAAALAYYKKSLEYSSTMPETYLKLANISNYFKEYAGQASYIREAWKHMEQFEHEDLMVELPGKYLESEIRILENPHSTEVLKINCSYLYNERQIPCKKLKYAIFLLKEIKHYKDILPNIQHIFTPANFTMLYDREIPTYDFQYYYGKLLLNIASILAENSVESILLWLDNKQDRQYLYNTILMPYNILSSSKHIEPKDKWDLAYLEGAIYHLQIATELNANDIRAAYELVKLSKKQIESNIDQNKKQVYIDLIEHHARHILEIKPILNQEDLESPINWALIKNLLDTVNKSSQL